MAAGGVGGYYGGVLARLGHDVSFIARGNHLKAIRDKGLTIKSVQGEFAVRPAKATGNPAEVGPVDWILFAVKAYDTVQAAYAMQPMVGEHTTVLTLQNGVDQHERIGDVVGRERILLGPTQIVSNIVAPGVIEQKSPFRSITIGEVGAKEVTPRVRHMVDELRRGGIDADAAPDGLVPLWHKFVFLACTGGLAALARTAPYNLFQLPEARETLRQAMVEVYAVGRAHSVQMDEDIVERQYKFALSLGPRDQPSVQLDLERGRRIEIDALSGAVVRLGASKGIPTPVHRTIYAALKMEDERAKRRPVVERC